MPSIQASGDGSGEDDRTDHVCDRRLLKREPIIGSVRLFVRISQARLSATMHTIRHGRADVRLPELPVV
jgi:hypothetical protein